MDYRGIVPAIDTFVGRKRKQFGPHEAGGFVPTHDGEVIVYKPDGVLGCHIDWAKKAIENLLDDTGVLRFDAIVAPVSYLGGVMLPYAFQAALAQTVNYRDLPIVFVDPNYKASWWHDRWIVSRSENANVLVLFDQFLYPPAFTRKYLDPPDFLDKLSLSKVDIVATVGVKVNPDIDHWGMNDSDLWIAALHPVLNPGKANEPSIIDLGTDPFHEYYYPIVEKMLDDHFIADGKPKFEVIAAPVLPLNASLMPYLVQRVMAKRGFKIPVQRFETWFKEKESPNTVEGKKVLIVHDAFYQTPTLRRHCPCCGQEYFNAASLSFDLQVKMKAEVLGTISLFDYGHMDSTDFPPIFPVAVLPN